MELFIKDRLYLPAFLKKENSLREFGLKKGIIEKVAMTESERESYGLHGDPETQQITWDVSKDTGINVEFSKDELEYLKKSCENMVDQSFPDEMWVVVEKIYQAANAE